VLARIHYLELEADHMGIETYLWTNGVRGERKDGQIPPLLGGRHESNPVTA